MGRHPMKGWFGSTIQRTSYTRLEQWSNTTLFLLKDLSRQHQFGPKVLPGKYCSVTYASHGEELWKGDIMVADIEELEDMDASEIHARRLNVKEVLTPMKGENVIFPIADGTVKLSGGDQVLRTSTLLNPRSPRPRRRTRKPSRRIRRVFFTTTWRLVVVWWWSQKWFLVHLKRFHLPSSCGTLSQTVRADWRIIPNSTEIHWRYQNYRHDVGCDVGEISTIIGHSHWQDTGPRLQELRRERARPVTSESSEPVPCGKRIGTLMKIENCQMHGQVSRDSLYWMKNHLTDIHGLVRDWRGNKRPQGPTMCGQICGKHVSDASKRKAKRKRAIEKPKLDNAKRLRGFYFIDPDDEEFQGYHEKCAYKVGNSDASSNASQTSTWQVQGNLWHRVGQHKTKCACIVEAGESMRVSMEASQSKIHEDHIAGEGVNSLSHDNLVRKFILMPEAMKTTRCPGSSGERRGKLKRYWHGSWRKSKK